MSWMLQGLVTARITPSVTVFNSFLTAASRDGDPFECEQWFRRMVWSKSAPDVISYTCLISSFARAGDPDRAERWFKKMLHTVQPVTTLSGNFVEPVLELMAPQKVPSLQGTVR
eukprot:Skav229262  [mRNA]  locus=scaffold952:42083:43033:- [translate_table: standard]